MKEKLLKVRGGLEKAIILLAPSDKQFGTIFGTQWRKEYVNLKNLLSELDSIISMLDSPKLVTKIVSAWDDSSFGDVEMYAKVAIESIME